MTKTKELAQSPLTEAEKKIDSLEKEIGSIQQEITQTEDALSLILNPPRFAPVQGQMPFFDKLNVILEASKTENERLEKVSAAQAAIAESKNLLAEKQNELTTNRTELENLKHESIWSERYQPFVDKFKADYILPTDQKKEITRLERFVVDSEKLLFEMESVFDTGDSIAIKIWERKNPGFAPLKSAISKQKDLITKWQEQLTQAKEINQQHFRKFIKDSVDLDGPLQTLLNCQKAYELAWQEFIQIAGDSSRVDFSVENLKKQKIPLVYCAEDTIKIKMQNLDFSP